RQPIEFFLARERAQTRIVGLQNAEEPHTVAVRVDAHAHARRGLVGIDNFLFYRAAAIEHVALELLLEAIQGAHAATTRASRRSPTRLATSSSASSSSRGGMLSSRSIMVD